MISKAPINPSRIRKITGSFSWLDHRLLHEGYLAAMEPAELLLYFFLVLVGDRNGISFYSYDKICALLKIDVERLLAARARLIDKSLIAFEDGRYQVLQLPTRPCRAVETAEQLRQAGSMQSRRAKQQDFVTFAELVEQLAIAKR
jgi:hypothetical protein